MPDHSLVLDGSWKEDTTYPVRDEMIKEREMRIQNEVKYRKMSEKDATEWIDGYFYTMEREDGLMKKLVQRADGSWTWMVHMQFTPKQQRFYDFISTM